MTSKIAFKEVAESTALPKPSAVVFPRKSGYVTSFKMTLTASIVACFCGRIPVA